MDGFITITDNKVMKFVVNTGTGKNYKKKKNGQNQISGKKLVKYTVLYVYEMS